MMHFGKTGTDTGGNEERGDKESQRSATKSGHERKLKPELITLSRGAFANSHPKNETTAASKLRLLVRTDFKNQ